MRKPWYAPLVLALVLALAMPAAAAPASVSHDYGLPAHLELDVTALECDNKGSTLEFTGTMSIGGLNIEVTFKNNVKGTHTTIANTSATMEVAPANGDFTVPKQPVQGGVGGNPWISVAFADKDGNFGKPMLLGRCVQGVSLKHISKTVLLPATAQALIESLECSNKGSRIKLSASRAAGALNGMLYLDNNKNKVVHQWQEAVSVAFSLNPPVDVPKQGSLDGPGGNPIISVKFLDDDGKAIGKEYGLGRCVKLG